MARRLFAPKSQLWTWILKIFAFATLSNVLCEVEDAEKIPYTILLHVRMMVRFCLDASIIVCLWRICAGYIQVTREESRLDWNGTNTQILGMNLQLWDWLKNKIPKSTNLIYVDISNITATEHCMKFTFMVLRKDVPNRNAHTRWQWGASRLAIVLKLAKPCLHWVFYKAEYLMYK